MKNGNKLTIALMFVAALILGSTLTVQSVSAQCGDPGCTRCASTSVMPAPIASACGCGQAACMGCAPVDASCGCGTSSCQKCRRIRLPRPLKNCRTCKTSCGCNQCPKCEGDVCKLELDDSKIKKTCFKAEQKPVCIPPVRFPWMKCCPPGKSKTRLVTKVSKHTYECPHCAYKWSVQKAAAPASTPTAAAPQVYESTPVYDSYLPNSGSIQPTESVAPPNGDTPPTDLVPRNVIPEVSPNAAPPVPTDTSSNRLPWKARTTSKNQTQGNFLIKRIR